MIKNKNISFEDLAENHPTTRVPESETVSGWHLAFVVIGVSIAIPAFIGGAELGVSLGIYDAFMSFFIGGIILTILGSLTAIISVRTRLSTYMLVKFSFGSGGAKMVNLVLAATLFGWFGVNAQQFGEAVYSVLTNNYGQYPNLDILVIVGAGLMIATAVFGFKALDKLASAAVPLLLIMLIAILYMSLAQVGAGDVELLSGKGDMTLGLGISAVVGADIVAVAVMPDLARYVKNNRQAIFAMILSFVIATPLILISAAVPALITGQTKPMLIISALGLSSYALLVVVLSTWTTNTNNLYSASLSVSAIIPKAKSWKSTIIIGVLGTVFALSGATDYFVDFLLLLGVAIPPIAGIYIVDYFLLQGDSYRPELIDESNAYSLSAMFAWLCGCVVAYLGVYHSLLLLTHIPACDGLLFACAIYWGMKKLSRMYSKKNLPCENVRSREA
jgi:cytosine permease